MKPTSHNRKPIGILLLLVLGIFISALPCSGSQDPQTFCHKASMKSGPLSLIWFFTDGK